MAAMTLHILPTYAYHDQKWYQKRYLRKPRDMKVCAFTTRLSQYFLPDYPCQFVTPLPNDEIKKILYHTMPNFWKKMTEQGYNYYDGSIQYMAEFFDTRIKNLERYNFLEISQRNGKRIILKKEILLTGRFRSGYLWSIGKRETILQVSWHLW